VPRYFQRAVEPLGSPSPLVEAEPCVRRYDERLAPLDGVGSWVRQLKVIDGCVDRRESLSVYQDLGVTDEAQGTLVLKLYDEALLARYDGDFGTR
jgi:hypothetical protein